MFSIEAKERKGTMGGNRRGIRAGGGQEAGGDGVGCGSHARAGGGRSEGH